MTQHTLTPAAATDRGIAPLPMIIVDTREKRPLTFRHLKSTRATLQSGDYSAGGLTDVFTVERKTMIDLVITLQRERDRFMRELHRLRGFPSARLLIIGTLAELNHLIAAGYTRLRLIEHNLLSIEERFQLPIHRVDTPEQAALLVETWAFTAWRNAAAKLGVVLPFPSWVAGFFSR